MSLTSWVSFPPLGDDRGSLVALEANKSVPFDIKRLYYIFGTREGVVRGLHAHKALKQVMVCITGFCQITLDNGNITESVLLESPTQGIYVEGLIWREMSNFSSDCVLLVIASEHYDESDYVRKYDEFMDLVKNALHT